MVWWQPDLSPWSSLSLNSECLGYGVGILKKIDPVLVLGESVLQGYYVLSRVEKSVPILKNQGLLDLGEFFNFVDFPSGERIYSPLNLNKLTSQEEGDESSLEARME